MSDQSKLGTWLPSAIERQWKTRKPNGVKHKKHALVCTAEWLVKGSRLYKAALSARYCSGPRRGRGDPPDGGRAAKNRPTLTGDAPCGLRPNLSDRRLSPIYVHVAWQESIYPQPPLCGPARSGTRARARLRCTFRGSATVSMQSGLEGFVC